MTNSPFDFSTSPEPDPASASAGRTNAAAQVASPIADLTYRNYEGPLQTRAVRWWIVALVGLRQALRKPGFWISVVLCVLPCLLFGLVLYFQGAAGMMARGAGTGGAANTDSRYASVFFQVIQAQNLFVFSVALTIGAGSIAADNSANALLVYLSKPLTKGDYLLGKWMSIFLLTFGAIVIPALLLYVFCLLLFLKDGFLSEEPLLLGRILVACAIPGVLYASVLVGVSAWSKTARAVGGIMAAFYFLSAILANILFAIFLHDSRDPSNSLLLLQSASLPGIISGLAQHTYGITSRVAGRGLTMGAPPLLPLALLFAVLVVVGVGAARIKIRAVEVVRG